jgi:hypothetical protein
MIGIILVTASAIMDEISTSIGKWEVQHKKEGIYTYGFLNTFWILVILVIVTLVRDGFVFSLDSLPLFMVLIVLEIAQTYSSLHAIVESDRTTNGFLMILTLPLLLVVDYTLGYQISLPALCGIGVIVLGLIFLFINHGLSKKGIGYVLFSTVNAVATISIYKYMITNYNSVEAQQIVTLSILVVYLFIMARWKSKQNPFLYMFKKEFLAQSIPRGVSGVLISFAYLFASPAVITSAKRGLLVLLSVITGKVYFHEKHIFIKIVSTGLVVVGIVLLTK